jgi:hypothetical protein
MNTVPLMYLDSPNSELWTYRDRGDVIVWSDTGETIMLASNAAALCKILLRELRGLPSLTAILFVSDALTKGWNKRQSTQRVHLLRNSIPKQFNSKAPDSHIVDWLESLGKLSARLRKGVNAQGAFMAEIWEDFPHSWLEIDEKDSPVAIEWLNITASERPNIEFSHENVSTYQSKKALQALEYASLLTIDEKAIQDRLKTGLDSTDELRSPHDSIQLKDPIQRLLDQLLQQAHTDDPGWVATLAWDLSLLISLPRKPSEPDDLQIGGVSDVSNRGNPERLLISELAADPDTLIARIATGQALYLRHESPPKSSPHTRDIWIENGIRCWGEQRITMLAFALATAAAEEKKGVKVRVNTLAGNQIFNENFSTLEGLTDALERLHTATHPGSAIELLIQKYDREKENFSEPLVIVTAATAKDPNFRDKLKLLPTPYLLAVIEPKSWVEIREHTTRGESVWKKVQLKPTKRLQKNVSSSHLPQFVRYKCSPLRFPCDLTAPYMKVFENDPKPGAWLITHNYRLLCFNTPDYGCIDLGSVPAADVLAATTPSNDSIHMVIAYHGGSKSELVHYLVTASLSDGIQYKMIQPDSDPHKIVKYYFDQGLLHRVGSQLDLINPRNGMILTQTPIRQRHLGGPFFGDRDLLIADVVNQSFVWRHLGKCNFPIGVVLRSPSGPIAVAADFLWTKRFTGTDEPETSTGRQIISTSQPNFIDYNHDHTVALITITKVEKTSGFSPDIAGKKELAISFFLSNRTLSHSRISPEEAIRSFDRSALQRPAGHNVRSRFNTIGVHQDGLLLSQNQNEVYLLRIMDQNFSLQYFRDPRNALNLIPFVDVVPHSEAVRRRWRLSRAELGRCTIWLDSRGLLHLRDADGVELSLMLLQNTTAGWFSKGELFGPSFFTAQATSKPSLAISDWFKGFIEQCCM